ncbi:unnamed protein product [Heligmosomoides polygyrus]|uniref:Uncharacterized protein n=1 Tax=Heligmosomoides polygyrus TaxID=6339 RepID=A0A183GBP7_HELPZ|nr:unnamed protein product [Heligmosomoides polygyrus]
MNGCRRVRHVYGSRCTVADVFGTSTARHTRWTTSSARLLNPDARWTTSSARLLNPDARLTTSSARLLNPDARWTTSSARILNL